MEAINLNLIPSGVLPVCHAKQFDKGRTIRINLFNGTAPLVLAGTETVSVNVRKPDKHTDAEPADHSTVVRSCS